MRAITRLGFPGKFRWFGRASSEILPALRLLAAARSGKGSALMNRFYRIVTERPALTLAFVLLATLYVGSGLRFLKTENNQDSELPKSDPIVRTNERLKEVFGDT